MLRLWVNSRNWRKIWTRCFLFTFSRFRAILKYKFHVHSHEHELTWNSWSNSFNLFMFSRPLTTRSFVPVVRPRARQLYSTMVPLFISSHCSFNCNRDTHRLRYNVEVSCPAVRRQATRVLIHLDRDRGTTLDDKTMPTRYRYQKCKYF